MHTRLIAIRHGKTISNVEDRVSGGQDDSPLVTEGIRQAIAARSSLLGSVATLHSSDRERCLVTGQIAFGLEIPDKNRTPELNERYYGTFDGGPNDAWEDHLDEIGYNDLSESERYHFAFDPGIENEQQLVARARRAFERVADLGKSQETGISTSGGILRAMILASGTYIPTGVIDNLARLDIDHDGDRFKIVHSEGIDFTDSRPW